MYIIEKCIWMSCYATLQFVLTYDVHRNGIKDSKMNKMSLKHLLNKQIIAEMSYMFRVFFLSSFSSFPCVSIITTGIIWKMLRLRSSVQSDQWVNDILSNILLSGQTNQNPTYNECCVIHDLLIKYLDVCLDAFIFIFVQFCFQNHSSS